ncbi:TPA: GNAT family N-acetyltransferase [Candidatus Poribacteria bacterium]|nr:GNAT family N-acetyltransferase [Candidatus Poribacteria bacterium]HIO45927.1 GNAT family N-acetyltransferase [Candidatus Poribacteria bacterium]
MMMSQELELHGTLQLRSAALEDAEELQTYCFPDQSVQEVTDHLAEDLEKRNRDEVYRIVAETGGHSIGQVRIERSVLENTTATIGDLKVLAPFRAFGVSTMLIEYAEQLAKDNGVQSLEIELSVSERSVIEAYRKWGYKERQTVVLEKFFNGTQMDEDTDPIEGTDQDGDADQIEFEVNEFNTDDEVTDV